MKLTKEKTWMTYNENQILNHLDQKKKNSDRHSPIGDSSVKIMHNSPSTRQPARKVIVTKLKTSQKASRDEQKLLEKFSCRHKKSR